MKTIGQLREEKQILINQYQNEFKDEKIIKEYLSKIKKIEKDIKKLKDIEKIEQIEIELQNIENCIKLCPKILEVIKKFNGKKSGKRFSKALEEINKDLHFRTIANSFIIEHWQYKISILHACIASSYNDGIEQNGVIIAENAEKEINKFVEYNSKKIEETRKNNNLETIYKFIEEKESILNQIKEFNNKIPYEIREKFDLNLKEY